jgi:serine/threonine-protein kinase
MALKSRMWGAGKLLVVLAALAATFVLFFAIAMRIALKTREVAVPPLSGRSVNEATAILDAHDLTLHVEDARRPDPKVPRGLVLAQEPPAGVVTRRSRSVRVWLSDGPRITIVPALVGESERTAQLRAQSDALALGAIAEIRSSEYAAGVVIAQWPEARTQGSSVALLVNRGEAGRTYVMPDLIGVNGVRAADLLRSRGFRVAIVSEQPYAGIPAGTVIRQQPSAGFQVGLSESISLEVSR